MKKIWIDYLRVIATIAVIVTHISSDFLNNINFNYGSNWWIGLFSSGSMRFCVPIFVMISGALLLPKQYSLKDHIQKRFTRVLIPFLFWSLIYISIDIALPIFDGEPLSITSSLKHIVARLIFGARAHMWYIYMILGIYLFMPFIQKWAIKYEINEMRLYIGLWIFTLVINWFIPSSLSEKGHDFGRGLDLTYFSGFLGYFIIGYYLSIKSVYANKKGNYYSILLIIIGLTATYLGTYLVSFYMNEYSRNFVKYLTPNVLAVSVGLFLLFKNNFNKPIKQPHLNQGIQIISKYSYGIYLSHFLILEHLAISNTLFNPIIGIMVTTLVCLILSLLITIIINKLPYGKYISG